MRLLSAADTAGLRSEYAALLRQSQTQAARDSEDASDSDDGETPGLRPASGDGRHRQCPCGLVRSCHVDQCPCGNRVYFPVAKPRRRKHRAPRPQSMRRQAASQRAVSLTENGGSVFVVDSNGQAAVRPVQLGAMVDGSWIVESGLQPGDVVIVSNLQKIRPGAPVQIANTPTGRKPASKPSAKQPERTSGGE